MLKDATRQVQACLCFGQQPASYECYMHRLMPINVNTFYYDPKKHARVEGVQSGVCVNADNKGCDVWQYFRGFCNNWIPLNVKNDQSSISVNAVTYCEVLQGRVDGENCVDLPTADGKKECSLDDLVRGNCKFAW